MTSDPIIDRQVRTTARITWLTKSLLYRDGQDVREKVASGTLGLNELEDLFAVDGSRSALKESVNIGEEPPAGGTSVGVSVIL